MGDENEMILQTRAAQGAFWKILSCTCFAAVSGLVYALTRLPVEKLPPTEIAFFQTILGALFLWIFWFVCAKKRIPFTLSQPGLAWARAFCLAVGVSLWFTALKYLPLAHVAAFKLLSPLIVLVGARLFLKEVLSPPRLWALGGGLLGAGLLFQKELGQSWIGEGDVPAGAIFLPLVALFVFAASNILAKRLLQQESPEKATFSLLILATPFLGFFSSFTWVTPSMDHLPFLLAMGFVSGVAYYALNKALGCADLTYLVPFGLTRFVVSALIAYFLFGEALGISLLLGATLIVLVSFGLLRIESKKEMSGL